MGTPYIRVEPSLVMSGSVVVRRSAACPDPDAALHGLHDRLAS